VVGDTLTTARAKLAAQGFTNVVTRDGEPGDAQDEPTVTSQSPRSGTKAKSTDRITLTVTVPAAPDPSGSATPSPTVPPGGDPGDGGGGLFG
jgi:beta-lactam-binding protein with PASTA domain